MRTERIFYRTSLALGLVALLAACDKSPTAPTALGPPEQQPPNQGQAPPERLQVGGPESVPPGETAQFTATAFYPGGSTRNVTAESTWKTQHSSVLSLSTQGLATAVDRGQSRIEASFGGKSAGRYVMVLPAGTFRLSGTVKEDGLLVSGAQVAVSAGPAQGLATTTADGKADSAAGYYFLYGVVGDVEISVTKPGYTEHRKSVRVTAQQSLDFALAPSAPRDIVDGNYTFTLSAADKCRPTLPAEAPRRTTAFAAPSSRTD